ncbi:MAG: peroxide stress protein YaaA, partial [Bowdeniella nasicola]|nr:peroxide stress protein YaaA [Bowdeniella nasicola]
MIVLPPSEGKARPISPRPVDLDTLFAPQLRAARRTVATALGALGTGEEACRQLKLGPKSADQVQWNTDLSWGAPAADIYTGVLYQAAHLSPATRAVVIFSALYGVLRPCDVIAPYRLPASARLPGLGAIGRWWKPHLAAVLDAQADAAGMVI